MNNSSTVCVDASLVIRRVVSLSGPVHAQWETWAQENCRLVAPALLYYEVTNGLYQYQKAGVLPVEAVNKSLAAALALPIELVSDSALHKRAKALAETYNLPASYDAHYLALAERLGADLWTTDERLVNSLKLFKITWVRLAGS